MKFYRVIYSTEGGNSGGFSFHTSKREAEARLKADYDNDPEEYFNDLIKAIERHIEVIEVKPTKAGILAALNYYGGNPQNG